MPVRLGEHRGSLQMACDVAERPRLHLCERSKLPNGSMLIRELECPDSQAALAILSTQMRNRVSISAAEVAG